MNEFRKYSTDILKRYAGKSIMASQGDHVSLCILDVLVAVLAILIAIYDKEK